MDHKYSLEVESNYNSEEILYGENESIIANNGIEEIDALLIDAVRNYPHLYDKSSRDFKDNIKKNSSWREIAEILNLPIEDCQARWTRLREKFSREKRLQELEERSGSGASNRTKFVYMNNMQFLNKFVKTRRTYTNIASLRNGSDNSGITHVHTETPVNLPPTNAVNQVLKINQSNKVLQSPISGQLLGNLSNQTNVSNSQLPTYEIEEKNDESNNTPPLKKRSAEADVHREIPMYVDKCYSTSKKGKRKQSEELDCVEKTLLQMSSSLSNQLGQQKESAELAFAKVVGLELEKMTEPKKTDKKKKIMEILYD